MGEGIAILGLNGGGKSTLAHALAKEIKYYEMDVEDYYFPEQKYSRQMALDNYYGVKCSHLGELPFSTPREKSEVQQLILNDIKAHPNFILAGVTMNWCEEIRSQFSLAFLIETPIEERIRRIKKREEARFGTRVRVGGDMFKQQLEFRNIIAQRDERIVKESALKLKCPVIVLDGMQTVFQNLETVIQHMNSIKNPRLPECDIDVGGVAAVL